MITFEHLLQGNGERESQSRFPQDSMFRETGTPVLGFTKNQKYLGT